MTKQTIVISLSLFACIPHENSTSGDASTTTSDGTHDSDTQAEPTTSSGTTDGPSSTSLPNQESTTDQPTECGNGEVDDEEECDDGAQANGTGQACKADCTNNVCGDGDWGPNETCDNGNFPYDGSYAHCNPDCQGSGGFCLDGVQQGPEECDDGSPWPVGACALCHDAKCGDGFLWQINLPEGQQPEECDDGNDVNNDDCSNECKVPKE